MTGMAVNKVLPLRAGPWHHSAGTNPVIKFLVKTMLRATFFEIFNIFLDKLTFEDLEILGLPDMERSTLEDYGYELVGDKSDCHAYEKEIIVPHRNTGLSLMHKLYFFADESVGTGLGVEPKVRLTTLLKAYWDYRDLRGGSLDNISFYFWDGNDEGAVVFEENIVVRFGFRQNRGAYLIDNVESGLDRVGSVPGVSVRSVKKYMNSFELDGAISRREVSKYPCAFSRLVGFLCKNSRRF